MAEKLAIEGGNPVRTTSMPLYNTLGEEERAAVNAVLDRGILSQFLGTWSPDFYGGPCVQALERAWEAHFGIAHAVSMNSATSALYAAVGAAGVSPGDEVIVSPYTMSASAAAALVYGGIPVFADIDPDTFCISPATIAARITSQTKAIIVVDIFGHPADFDGIMALAHEHGLVVIEDCAQAPGASYHDRPAGTLADIGVYSLNYHKTIHCGEGGVAVTDDPALAERLQLIRNHGEVVVKGKGVENLVNMVGFNYRMTEIEAAIAGEQLKKLPALVAKRQQNADYLRSCMAELAGIAQPLVQEGCTHGYYVYAMKFDSAKFGVPREEFVAAVCAEGIPLRQGYVEPLYLQPLYQQRIAFGAHGYPFTEARNMLDYSRGSCPVAERMYSTELLLGDFCHSALTVDDLDDISKSIRKVWKRYAR
ncbi:DegT/DnrJ/EryC1/StrS family aminotransferase [Chitinilyticum aquatile]|uniref:DegT/DnrJ/EryC1/StrS family aminotransferase n=1 Tax=Chitinilyticum aquatile TaxID=362520 RepID=UPI0003FEC07D|nr:DegT/DnrJ/EryC1/StrS family aminotransferase [Chitinilyticum aquatile]